MKPAPDTGRWISNSAPASRSATICFLRRIARFARRHRDVRFHVAVGNTDFVVASVRQFESDAGWVERLSRHPDLEAFPWREDRLVIVARLCSTFWSNWAGSGRSIKRAVMCDAGLGCISRSAVEPELRARQLRLVHTPWLDLRRQITLLVHRQKYIDRGLREFPRFCGVALTAEHDATSNIPFAGRGSDGGNRGTRSDVRPASGGSIRPHRVPKRDSRYSTGHTLDSPR